MSIGKQGINDMLMEATKQFNNPRGLLELLLGAKKLLLESKKYNAKVYAEKVQGIITIVRGLPRNTDMTRIELVTQILDLANEIKHKNIEG